MNEPTRPDVCVVIPSFRSRGTIEAAVDSIFRQAVAARIEILVVESSGDEMGWLTERYPAVRMIASPRRLFPGAARNEGARQTDAPVLAFLDADATAATDWLALLLARLADPEVKLAGGAVANANPESVSSRILHWIEFSEYIPGLPSGFRKALSSSNLVVCREDFLKTGGFEETYGMAEDLFFTMRLASGLFFEGQALVRHRHRSSWAAVTQHLEALGFWSGHYRREQATSGSWLARFPPLCVGLPLVRGPRIVRRVWRANGREGLIAFALSPLLLAGLGYWTKGFYRGLTAGNPASSPGTSGS